jgi:hypothetical protein
MPKGSAHAWVEGRHSQHTPKGRASRFGSTVNGKGRAGKRSSVGPANQQEQRLGEPLHAVRT